MVGIVVERERAFLLPSDRQERLGLSEEPVGEWEGEVVGWAMGKSELWSGIDRRVRSALKLCFIKGLKPEFVSERLGSIFSLPPQEVSRMRDESFSRLAQAWGEEVEEPDEPDKSAAFAGDGRREQTKTAFVEEDEEDDWDHEKGFNEDPIRQYLQEIGQFKVLTQEEEVYLGYLMTKARAVREYPVASPEIIAKYLELGDTVQPRQKMVNHNLRLVVSVAKKYLGRGMSLLDLIQEGSIGLLRAVDKYDFQKGFKFSTYATWWIRQAITRAIADQARTIRLPVHMVETANKLRRTTVALTQELGREPTKEELAKASGQTVKAVENVVKVSQQPVSLSTPIKEDESSVLGDFIEDESQPPPDEEVSYTLLKEQIRDVLADLPPRDRRVLTLRFGLDDGRQRTLEEVGREYDLTRERIRQIEAKALSKLRHPRNRHYKQLKELAHISAGHLTS